MIKLPGEWTGMINVPDDRRNALQILDEGMADGARGRQLALLFGVVLSTLQRWRSQYAGEGDEMTAARCATAMWRTVSVRRSGNGFC